MAASRRLYQDIADGIRYQYAISDEEDKPVIRRVVENMCNALRADNPNFNRDLFLAACGWGPKTCDVTWTPSLSRQNI